MTQDTDAPTFEGFIVVGALANVGAPADVGLLTLKAVHYPGSQQLMLWLPRTGYQGYGDVTVIGPSGERETASVRSRLNGSVQILWDTLAWQPGAYRIEITHADGWRHIADMEKLVEGAPAPAPPVVSAPAPPSAPIVYRDGFGKIIPDVDLELRAQAIKDIAQKFGRRLEYEGSFRGGTIIYIDGERRIRFSHEMAGAPYKFTIDIPSVARWEAETGAPVSERDEIVRFLAAQVQREQASTWTYEIRETDIVFR